MTLSSTPQSGANGAVILCPGCHSPALTRQFLRAWCDYQRNSSLAAHPVHVFWDHPTWAWSGPHILAMMSAIALRNTPLVLIGFSAGVVGALSAALTWEMQGGWVRGLIAMDGWGIPLLCPFPSVRLSHDAFTHASGPWMGQESPSFYADPDVLHHQLWSQSEQVFGWQVVAGERVATTALAFVATQVDQWLEKL